MKVWLAHIFYTCLGNFKSRCFVFPIIIPLVNEGLQNYLIDGRVVPKIGFARLFNWHQMMYLFEVRPLPRLKTLFVESENFLYLL